MAMNALSLYVTTTRMIFQADIDDSGAWADINRLILYLRQALTCCVCGKLLTIPMSSTVSSCQHHVCKPCVGGKMRLKPSCSWCKDHSKFIENTQLRILLQLYKRLCDYIISSKIPQKWGQLNCGGVTGTPIGTTANNNIVSGPTNFTELISEGAELADKYNFSEPPPLRGFSRNPTNSSSGSCATSQQMTNGTAAVANSSNLTRIVINGTGSDIASTLTNGVTISKSEPIKHQTDTVNDTNAKSVDTSALQNTTPVAIQVTNLPDLTGTKTVTVSNFLTNGTTTSVLKPIRCITTSSTNTTSTATCSNIQQPAVISLSSLTSAMKVKPKRRGCRCGLATANPGKLTCCGQRCPCYVDGKGCFECKCRGCRNPHKPNSTPNANKDRFAPTSLSLSLSSVPTTPLQASIQTLNQVVAASLSPSLLLTSASGSITLGSSLLTSSPSRSNINGPSTTINILSSTSSSPTAAIIGVVGGSTAGMVGSESLNLPFPKLEEVDDSDQVIDDDDDGSMGATAMGSDESENLIAEVDASIDGTTDTIIHIVGDDVGID